MTGEKQHGLIGGLCRVAEIDQGQAEGVVVEIGQMLDGESQPCQRCRHIRRVIDGIGQRGNLAVCTVADDQRDLVLGPGRMCRHQRQQQRAENLGAQRFLQNTAEDLTRHADDFSADLPQQPNRFRHLLLTQRFQGDISHAAYAVSTSGSHCRGAVATAIPARKIHLGWVSRNPAMVQAWTRFYARRGFDQTPS